jgi:XRE family transcriptional regulator, aerobic/anaerobic benzoate catabolism transcriptional regulator
MSQDAPKYLTLKRSALLAEVGLRVRILRDNRGLTQRALAARSGVSPRYLAQLEAGDANMSVERLSDVAEALGTELTALLDPRPVTREAVPRLLERSPEAALLRRGIDQSLDGRDLGELKEVKRWIEARFAKRTAPVIALLGLRGAGKSSVGKQLAVKLGLPFVELDQLIESTAGLSLAEIFELHGERYYRRLERETLSSLLTDPKGLVLATGGSLVNDRETYKLLRRRAVTVWLKARAEDHWERVLKQGDQRPMGQNPHAMAELRALLAAREKQYSEAEHVIDTSKLDVDTTVQMLVAELGRWQR